MSAALQNTEALDGRGAGPPGVGAAPADPALLDHYFAEVYEELLRIAHGRLGGASPTLDTVAVVHEAYAKLRRAAVEWEGPYHVRAVACRAMRQIVCNYLRDKRSLKRGGEGQAVTLDERLVSGQALDEAGVLDLDGALDALEAVMPRQARVVELRFFGGYEIEEVVEVLGISSATVKRDWHAARLFLRRCMEAKRQEAPPSPGPA